MKITLNNLAYVTAIAMAAFSGTIATIGLANFAPGMELPVYVMGALFEAGQLIAFSWLRQNWGKVPPPPITLRIGLLVLASTVVILDIMGAAGMLSKSYESRRAVATANYERSIAAADAIVRQAEAVLADIDRQTSALDEQISKAADAKIKARDDYGRLRAAKAALADAEGQRPGLVAARADAAAKMIAAQTERGGIKGQHVETDFVAIQFFATTFDADPDKVVHWALYVIATILVGFSPALVMAAASPHDKPPPEPTKPAEMAPVLAIQAFSEGPALVALPTPKTPRAKAERATSKASKAAAKGWETRRRNAAASNNKVVTLGR